MIIPKKIISLEKPYTRFKNNQNLNYKMSFQKFKSDSFCVVGGHRSATKNNYGDIPSKGGEVLNAHCSNCSRKNL